MRIYYLKKNEIIKLSNVFKKNVLSILIVMLLLLIVTFVLGLLINIEFKNFWLNYNILFNSILERTRSYYIGFNDGLLQFHTCSEILSPYIEKKMLNYIQELDNIISSFPFSFCLNMFNLNPMLGGINTLYYKKKNISYFFKQLSSFGSVIDDIDKCLSNILPFTLAQQSIFLRQPIIDSKKQLWSIHQRMINYTIDVGDSANNLTFGPDSSICNHFLSVDLEGGPTITGVVLNDSYYQAPLFYVNNIELIKVSILNHIMNINEGNTDSTESLEDILLEYGISNNKRRLYSLDFNKIQFEKVKKTKNNSFINKDNNKITNQDHYSFFVQNKYTDTNIDYTETKLNRVNSSFETNIVNGDINSDKMKSNTLENDKGNTNSVFTGMRTIYLPTSQVLNNIQVFTTGMKEIQRNSKLKLNNNIKKIKIFSFFILLATSVITILIFIPLILVETEKREKIFKAHGYIVEQRYKYYKNKYTEDVKYSIEILNFILFIHVVDICLISMDNIKKLDKHSKDGIKCKLFLEIELICEQLNNIIKHNIHSLWEIAFFSRFVNSFNDKKMFRQKNDLKSLHMNFNLFIELIITLLPLKYPKINFKFSQKILSNEMIVTEFTDIINSYLIIATLIFSIDQIIGGMKNVLIETKEEKLQIKISIEGNKLSNIIQKKDTKVTKIVDMARNYILSFGSKKILERRIETEIIRNDLFEELIKLSHIQHTLIFDGNEIIAEIHGIYGNGYISTIKTSQNVETKIQKQETMFILLSNSNNSHNQTIREVLMNICGVEFDSTNKMLHFFSGVQSRTFVIFAEKSFINLDKDLRKILATIKFKPLIYIYWFESVSSNKKLKQNEYEYILINKQKIGVDQKCNNIMDTKQVNSFLIKSITIHKIRAIIESHSIKPNELKTKYLAKKMIYKILLIFYTYNESKYNHLAKYILLSESNNPSINNTTVMELKSPNSYFRLYKRGVPINTLKRIYIFHLMPTYDFVLPNFKEIKIDLQNKLSNNDLGQVKASEIASAISDLFKLIFTDNFEYETVELLMELWDFTANLHENSYEYLPFFSPHLVLHCNIFLGTFIKKSGHFIKEILKTKDVAVALIICFMVVPLCKPGISSEVLTFANSPVSLYANEIATIENYVCKSIISILELPRFSKLFDSLKECKELILLMILSLNSRISTDIQNAIYENTNDTKRLYFPQVTNSMIINYTNNMERVFITHINL
ncbi:hypothetical protein RS030_111718 [Cryptosporidium xiaoi]|uniref:Uncharacterized protein n=1 Tax=Cryptosporidium xiaoi TaxID=659607 RepID=A0AAV9Y304_9CRYT